MTETVARGSAGVVCTRFVDLPRPLPLDSGGKLFPVRIAYETYGTLAPRRDNVVLICHALSGDAHAAGWSEERNAPATIDGFGAEDGRSNRAGLGWWDNLIGPGKAFDTDRYYVICTNIIGSCRGSTGPASIDPHTGVPYALTFPTVTVSDMVRAQRMALDKLGIQRLLAVSGGSLGGMQALEWALAYPEDVDSVITTASTGRLGTQGVAWNAIARNAIMADPDWQGGSYYGTGRAPTAGIGIARQVGHITYLSADGLERKFGRTLQNGGDYSYSVDGADFAVESYLRYQAASFAARFDANSYLYISRALTYFDLARSYGGSLEAAMARAQARFLLLSFSSDWLYPSRDSAALLVALCANGKEAEHHILDVPYGHDSFILDSAHQGPLIAEFLARVSSHLAHGATP